MNIIKHCLLVLASVLLCGSLAGYALHSACAKVATQVFVEEVVDQMSTKAVSQLQQYTAFLPQEMQSQLNEHLASLPEKSQEVLAELQASLVQDAQLQEVSKAYLDALIAKTLGDETPLPEESFIVSQFVEAYVPQLAQSAGISFTDEQVATIGSELASLIHLNQQMEALATSLQESISPIQKQTLSALRFFESSTLRWMAIAGCIMALVLIVLCTKSAILWLLYGGGALLVCAGGLLGGSKLATIFLTGGTLEASNVLSHALRTILDGLFQYGKWFGILAIGCFLVYAIVQFLRNHLVYE